MNKIALVSFGTFGAGRLNKGMGSESPHENGAVGVEKFGSSVKAGHWGLSLRRQDFFRLRHKSEELQGQNGRGNSPASF